MSASEVILVIVLFAPLMVVFAIYTFVAWCELGGGIMFGCLLIVLGILILGYEPIPT